MNKNLLAWRPICCQMLPMMASLIAATLSVLSVARADSLKFSITDLGTLGGPASEAAGISNVGVVVGKTAIVNLPVTPASASSIPATNNVTLQSTHGFLWQNGKMADLATLGGRDSQATALNSNQQVAGISYKVNGYPHAVLWDKGALTDLGTLGGSLSFAYGLNAKGQICGTAYTTLNRALSHAFVWQKDQTEPGGTMTDIGTLGGINSTALAINDVGQATGFAYTKTGDYHAFVWKGGAMKDLGTLGGRYSVGRSLNSQGQVVGHSLTTTGQQHAFLMSGGKMTDLYPFSSDYSDAFSINTWGQVVGMAELPTGEYHAFGYANGTVYDLNTLIPAGSGWVLQEAHGINDWGQIVGFGSINGLKHAFLMTPNAVDVTKYVTITRGVFQYNATTKLYSQQVILKNGSGVAMPVPISLALDSLSATATLLAPTGSTAVTTPAGSPYVNAPISGSLFTAGQTVTLTLQFRNSTTKPITYTPRILAGPGSR